MPPTHRCDTSTPTDVEEVIRTEQLTKVYPGDIRAVDGST